MINFGILQMQLTNIDTKLRKDLHYRVFEAVTRMNKCTLLRTSVFEVPSILTLAMCYGDHIKQAAVTSNFPHDRQLLRDCN